MESPRVHIFLHYITVNRGPSLLLVGMSMNNKHITEMKWKQSMCSYILKNSEKNNATTAV